MINTLSSDWSIFYILSSDWYKVGDLMLVKDHINFLGLAGESPLRGPNDEAFGPRFFSINNLYDSKWRAIALEASQQVL